MQTHIDAPEYNASLLERYGNYYVFIRPRLGERHSTTRARARKAAKEHLGPKFEILAYLGQDYNGWMHFSAVNITSEGTE